MVQQVVPPPVAGFKGDGLSREHFLLLSRNFALDREVPVSRRGYSIRRSQPTGTLVYTERIPVDNGAGSMYAAIVRGSAVYEDLITPSVLGSLSENPYGAADNAIPRWEHAYGRTVLVNGTDFRILIEDGGSLAFLDALPDPVNPVLGAVAGGSLTQGNPWYVRIRWYDSKTGTFSGPSQRLVTAASITLSGGNQSIGVTRPAPPSRATHWQVQLVFLTDTPSGYEISFDVGTAGFIPVATTNVTVTLAPASGTRFEFRTDAAQTLYRHSNPPPAHFVVFWKGRWFYAARDDIWLVWTDVGNPEHFYHDTTDPTQGFNTALGDGIGDSISGPCTGLFCNQLNLYHATLGEINMAEGSWEEVFDENGVFTGRRARISPLTRNGLGAVSAAYAVVDQEIYFVSPRGPALISGGSVGSLDPPAMRNLWTARDRRFDHRLKVAYDPEADTVLFSLVTQQTPATGGADLLLPWHRPKRVWCPPWTLQTTGMTLCRFDTDAGVKRGLRLILGSWHGQQLEYGVGDGDGWDGSHTDAAGLTPSSATAVSATVSGKAWTGNEHAGKSLILVDPQGNWHPRQIHTNSTDALEWLGSVTGLATTWTLYIGGIPAQWHFCEYGPVEFKVTKVAVPLDDQPSRRGT